MKVDYEVNNKFKLRNEVYGAVVRRKSFKKNKNKKLRTYMYYNTIDLFKILLISFILLILSIVFDISFLCDISDLIIYISILIYIYNYIVIKYSDKSLLNNLSDKHGTLLLDENGLTDCCSNGNSIKIDYRNIEFVVINKHAIGFITKYKYQIFMPNVEKDKIIKYLNKHTNLLIIDGTLK